MESSSSSLIIAPNEADDRAQQTSLRETSQTKLEGLMFLREQVKDLGLSEDVTDDFLLRFLRARNFNYEKASQVLQKYIKIKRENPDLFAVAGDREILNVYTNQSQLMTQGRDRQGAKVYIVRVGKIEVDKSNLDMCLQRFFRSNILALEWALLEERNQITGLTVLVDMKGFNIRKYSPLYKTSIVKIAIEIIQEAFPLKFKGFHIVFQPSYFDGMFSIMKPFLRDKIKKRIFLHGSNMSSLHQFFDPMILPSEYGGLGSSFDNSSWVEEISAEFHLIIDFGTPAVSSTTENQV